MKHWTKVAAVAAGTMLVVSACGDDDDTTVAAEDAIEEGLEGVEITVGSKEFIEQHVLGQIAIVALEAAGATVSDQTGIEGTPAVRTALEAGEIDLYWEYTGTGWSTILGHEIAEAPTDTEELYQAVSEEDAGNDIVWLDAAPVNNTYAIATAPGVASGLGISTLSEYAQLVQDNPDEATLCAAAEFLVRDDGLPGMEETYIRKGTAQNKNAVYDMYTRFFRWASDRRSWQLFAWRGAVSPMARAIESMIPVRMPAIDMGKVTFLRVCHLSAPSA
jgi:osmoprotectant transport system substrate-binding protein